MTKAIKINPQYADAYHYRGIAYQKLSKENLALLDFEKAESLKNSNINP